MNHSTTIAEDIRDRAEAGLADLLLTIADYFYCQGAGLAQATIEHAGLRDLLTTLNARYHAEILASRGWDVSPIPSDELPAWLLAHAERQSLPRHIAPPEEGWGTEGWPV